MTLRPLDRTRYLDDEEFKSLERTLVKLDNEVLDECDIEFVEDICRRVIKHNRRVVLTERQRREIERMKEKYEV